MKKYIYFIAILFIVACSSDDDNSQLSVTDLLTQNSPWTFNHYEMATIIDAGGSDFTQQDIENDIDQANNGAFVTFNNDGIGSNFSPEEGIDTWEWEIVNTNDIMITFESGNTETLENFSVTSSKFSFEGEFITFDPVVDFEVLHYGKFIYN